MSIASVPPVQGQPLGVLAKCFTWLRIHIYTVVVVCLLAGLAVPFLVKKKSEWDEVYLLAAQHLRAGEQMYLLEDMYLYPPFMAMLAIPFTYLPHLGSRAAWFLVNSVCLVALLRGAWRLSGGSVLESASSDKRENLICWLGLAVALRYALNGFDHQQTDLVIAALLIAGCTALLQSRSLRAATWFGLATAMKCTPLLWCVYLAWKGRWRAAAWLVCVAVGVNLLPNLISTPPQGGLWASEWLHRYIQPLTSRNYKPGEWGSLIIWNQSLAGEGNRLFTANWIWTGKEWEVTPASGAMNAVALKALVYGTDALLVVMALWLWRRRAPAHEQRDRRHTPALEVFEFSMVLALMVLLSPMSSKPHFSTLLIPGFCLARLAVYQGNRLLWAMLVAAIVASTISLPIVGNYLSGYAMLWGAVTCCAFLSLVGCGYVLYRERGITPSEQRDQKPICLTTRAAA